jgi:hypothetical protein
MGIISSGAGGAVGQEDVTIYYIILYKKYILPHYCPTAPLPAPPAPLPAPQMPHT